MTNSGPTAFRMTHQQHASVRIARTVTGPDRLLQRVVLPLLLLLLLLMLAPFILGITLQVLMGVTVAILPWLLLAAVIAGLVAGVTGAVIVSRRLPPTGGTTPLPPGTPPLGAYRIRRPRGAN